MTTRSEHSRETLDHLRYALSAALLSSGRHLEPTLDPQVHFWNELGLDSLDAQDFFVRVTEQFGVVIPDELFFELNTLARVASFVEAER